MTEFFDLMDNKISMEVDLNLDKSKKLLMKLENLDVIRYSSDRVPDGKYVVFNIDKDVTIPAILCEIWAFEGRFDHAFHRFIENDINVNKVVDFYKPKKHTGIIKKIVNYRDARSDLSDKEIFHFDLEPREILEEPSGECVHPYELTVTIGEKMEQLILPQWTPIQKIPVDKIKPGTTVEIWEVEGVFVIMKVLKL